eukprot:362746-Chlamydomonas_euryale.AAC.3
MSQGTSETAVLERARRSRTALRALSRGTVELAAGAPGRGDAARAGGGPLPAREQAKHPHRQKQWGARGIRSTRRGHQRLPVALTAHVYWCCVRSAHTALTAHTVHTAHSAHAPTRSPTQGRTGEVIPLWTSIPER